MTRSEFTKQLAALRSRIAVTSTAGEDPASAERDRLLAALEGLEAAQDELRRQHEELAGALQASESERQRYHDLFEYAPDGYLVTDLAGIIQEANQAASALLNVPQRRLSGTSLASLASAEDRAAFAAELTRLGTLDRPQEGVLRLAPRHAPAFNAALTVAPVRDRHGKPVGLRWLIRDLTDRVRLEEELRRAYEDLEVRIQERTQALAAANASLQAEIQDRLRAENQLLAFAAKLSRSNRELEDFTSAAAHDLQEPLRKILVFGDRLRAAWEHAEKDQGLDYLDRMQDAALRMRSLIHDLFAYAKVTTSGQPFGRVDLNETVQAVLSDLEVLLEQSGGRVEVGTLPALEANPGQMRQLLQNLIGNALKFHRPGDPPRVRVSGRIVPVTVGLEDGESAQDRCEIQVEDNGIGFEIRHLPRIFTLFNRLHSRAEYPGTGVGLAICRKIAHGHGGDITATSEPGRGATFVVTLPLEQPKRKAES